MAEIKFNRMTNANVIINGTSTLGQFEEFNCPTLKNMMAEHKWLGGQGKIEFPSGFDKVKAKGKWNSFYEDSMAIMYNPYTPMDLQVRGSLETYENGGRTRERAYVVYLRCTSEDMPTGNFKMNDNSEFESNFNVSYFKVEVDGRPLLEYDANAGIHRVDGVDTQANYRANIGAN